MVGEDHFTCNFTVIKMHNWWRHLSWTIFSTCWHRTLRVPSNIICMQHLELKVRQFMHMHDVKGTLWHHRNGCCPFWLGTFLTCDSALCFWQQNSAADSFWPQIWHIRYSPKQETSYIAAVWRHDFSHTPAVREDKCSNPTLTALV